MDDIRAWIADTSQNSAVLATLAACVRWFVSPAGARELLVYIASSLLVTWGAWLWLFDEHLTDHRSTFYTLLLAFVARDILVVIAGIAVQLRLDPVGNIIKLWTAFRRPPP